MTFSLEISQIKMFRSIIDAMVPIGEKTLFEIHEDGLKAQVFHSSNSWTSLVKLRKTFFKSLDVEQKSQFALNLEDISQFIKNAKTDDVLSIKLNTQDSTIDLSMESNSMKRDYKIRLEEVGETKFKEFIGPSSDQAFHSLVTFDVGSLVDAIKTLELAGEYVEVRHAKSGLKMKSASENKVRTVSTELQYSDDNVRDMVFRETGRARKGAPEEKLPETLEANYNLSYFKGSLKLGKAGEDIIFSMWHGGPLRIQFKINDDEGDLGFMLSPMHLDTMNRK